MQTVGGVRGFLTVASLPPSPSPRGSASLPPPAADPQLRSRFRGAGPFRRPLGRRTRAPAAPPPRTAAGGLPRPLARTEPRLALDGGPGVHPGAPHSVKLDTRNNQSGSRPAGSLPLPPPEGQRLAQRCSPPLGAPEPGIELDVWKKVVCVFCQCTCPPPNIYRYPSSPQFSSLIYPPHPQPSG